MDSDRELRRDARRRQVRRRKAVAAGVLLLLVLGGGAAAALLLHRSAAPVATTTRPMRQFHIVFPEGFTRSQMAARVAYIAKKAQREIHHHPVKLREKAYLAASRPQRIPGFGSKKVHLEGFLFPDTYNFDKTSTGKFLVHIQLQNFQTKWKSVDLSYARSKHLTPYDVLKIASLIQAEIAVPSENKLAAAVIYNRLHLGMPLQIDASTRYGLHIPPTQSLTQSELNSKNPFNLRNKKGLPPTPICNPGLAAIVAAAHPAHVNYLYYVRKADHLHHYFTASYQDFLNHGG